MIIFNINSSGGAHLQEISKEMDMSATIRDFQHLNQQHCQWYTLILERLEAIVESQLIEDGETVAAPFLEAKENFPVTDYVGERGSTNEVVARLRNQIANLERLIFSITQLIAKWEREISIQSHEQYLLAKNTYAANGDLASVREQIKIAIKGFALVGYENLSEEIGVTCFYGKILLESAIDKTNRDSSEQKRALSLYRGAIQTFVNLYHYVPEEDQTLKKQLLSYQCRANEFFGYALLKYGHPTDAARAFQESLNLHSLVSRHHADCFPYPLDLSRIYLSLAVALQSLGNKPESIRYLELAMKLQQRKL